MVNAPEPQPLPAPLLLQEAFDRVIDQTQSALSKLVDSSHMLLTVTRRHAAEVAALGALPGVQATAAGQVGTARAALLSR